MVRHSSWESLAPPDVQAVGALKDERAAFLTTLQAMYPPDGDPASEATLQQLPGLIARYWQTLSSTQSELATWQMLLRSTETLQRTRYLRTKGQANEERNAALAQWWNEVRQAAGVTGPEPVDEALDEEEGEEDEDD